MMGSYRKLDGLRVLVTGSGGFAGSAIVRTLLKEKCRVLATVSAGSGATRLAGLGGELEIRQADLTQRESVERLIAETIPQAVVHAAGLGSSPGGQHDPARFSAANKMMAENLVEALKHMTIQSVIQLGSSLEYGHYPHPTRETDVPVPGTPFGASKLEVTRIFQAAGTEGLPVTTLRLYSVYGPREHPGRLIPAAIRASLSGDSLPLTEGTFRRDLIFIDDAAEAVVAALKIPRACGEIFNIGTGTQTSNDEVVKLIGQVTGRPVKVFRGAYPPRLSDTDCWVSDSSKANQVLGWRAETSLRDGLRKTARWLAEQESI